MDARLFRLAIASALVASAAMAQAQDTGVVYAGAGGGQGYDLNAGVMVSLPGSTLGNGFGVRVGGGFGEYDYQSGNTNIDGRYLTAEGALVYQNSGDWGWANFGVGTRITDTDLDPADPGNKLAGTRWDAALSTDGALGNDWRLGWYGSLGVVDQTYQGQLRLGKLIDRQAESRIGLETAIQGDDSYTRGSLGLFASTRIADKAEARLSGGFSEQRGRSAKPYASINFSRTF